jgi:hypothetical protein
MITEPNRQLRIPDIDSGLNHNQAMKTAVPPLSGMCMA